MSEERGFGGFSEVPNEEVEGRREAPLDDDAAAPETGLGRLLDASWAVFTKRFWALVGFQAMVFALVIVLVIAVFAFVIGSSEGGGADWVRDLERWEPEDGIGASVAAVIGGVVVIGLLIFVLTYVAQGAITWLSFRQMQGGKGSFGEAFSVGIQKAVPAIVVALAAGLIVLLCAAAPIAALVGATGGFAQDEPPVAMIVLGGLLAVVPVAFLMTAWWLVIPVIVVEGRWLSALGRSWSLTKGHRWTIFGLIVILQLLSAAVGAVPLVGAFLQVASTTFLAVVPAVTYYAIRHAKEGVGLDDMISAFD